MRHTTQALLEAFARPVEMTLTCATCGERRAVPIEAGMAVWDLRLSDARATVATEAAEGGWRVSWSHRTVCPECARSTPEADLIQEREIA